MWALLPGYGSWGEDWVPAISTSALAQLNPHDLRLTMAKHQGLIQAIGSISLLFLKELFWVSVHPLPRLDAPAKGSGLCTAGAAAGSTGCPGL